MTGSRIAAVQQMGGLQGVATWDTSRNDLAGVGCRRKQSESASTLLIDGAADALVDELAFAILALVSGKDLGLASGRLGGGGISLVPGRDLQRAFSG